VGYLERGLDLLVGKLSRRVVPCVLFEDEHLLVVSKPPGLNTHAPSPYAGEGIYDWLRSHEPRWASLAIIHRLDKETSGVMVFSKTELANRSLTDQFTARVVRKRYLLITDRPVSRKEQLIRTSLIRMGESYASRARGQGGEPAETRFRPAAASTEISAGRFGSEDAGRRARLTYLEAEPLTGRTHQIRVHAAENGFPILGDTLYGGTPAARVFLHAAEIAFDHPASGQPVKFSAPARFDQDPRQLLRQALLETRANACWRINHGAADGRPGWYVDRLEEYLLAQSTCPLTEAQLSLLSKWIHAGSQRGVYHKLLDRQVRRADPSAASPRLILGEPAPRPFIVRENTLSFELSFEEGYSTGLFLDQRENRRRLLTGYVGPGFSLGEISGPRHAEPLQVLNAFAYTCAFSVCAAKAGARTTSLDLSRKYLEWGRRNFLLNGLDPKDHDFIYGDVFDWLRRLGRKGRRFGLILLDPPTFSTSKQSGTFKAEKDYGKLVASALPLLTPGGVLFASSNAAGWAPEDFLAQVPRAIKDAGRDVLKEQYVPQPPDFPIVRAEPAYLKTVWMRVR